ncbi:Outer membrane protein beta-barrel domain-containing protein [Chryseobacterium arachidis]|uniref:Outer membrane protein beta-barrel domain-containing protein n=1 Tax=Chryseobacterium arachidis TaxID=1416778 RepID=A0A1M5J9Y1_9FLAO|nr:outer membrane beta-barrel protein [Chryseobacterium arachidis]SHG37368.1 Outer membrane protein beta-barrel domain-containing protein [Chryseobacterium arachidis]
MSNDWLNDLRKKMEDHTEDVPDGLWKNIRDEIFTEEEDKKIIPIVNTDLKAQSKNSSKTNYKPLLYRIGSVAAAIVIFFMLGRLIDFDFKKEFSETENSQQGKTKSDDLSFKDQIVSNIIREKNEDLQNSIQKENDLNFDNQTNTNHVFANNVFINPLDKIINSASDILKDNQSQNFSNNKTESLSENNLAQEEIKNAVEGQQKIDETSETHELLTKQEREWKEKFEEDKKAKLAGSKIKKSWTVGVLTGNASSNSTDQFPGYATLNGTMPILPEIWTAELGEDPLMAILLANQDKKVDATIKHKTPITFGASVYYNIGKRWGIGTGINYTKLSAQLTSGNGNNFISSEQNIHYIGIPVQVNYNVIQKGAFTGYVTGGGMIEKAVSGDVKTKYNVEGVTKDQTEEKISEKPVQVSVNTAVGLQLKIIKNIGIYAEPGVGYHFKDNSSLNTIYKEKPLNFNLKFGIRLMLD